MQISEPFEFGGLRVRAALVSQGELPPAGFRFSHYAASMAEVWIENLGPANPVAARDLDTAIAAELAAHPQTPTWTGAR